MKKLLALILTVFLLLSSFAACGVWEEGGNSSSSSLSDSLGDSLSDSSVNSSSDGAGDSSGGGVDEENLIDMQPAFDEEGSVLYGLYPQTRVSDESIIAELSTLSRSEINGWYLYGGEYYAKTTATVYNGEAYAFDDGAAIVNGEVYYFKCEPIKWRILSDESGSYYLLSTLLLDAQPYYTDYENREIGGKTVYANDYAHSYLRQWLNGEFYKTAFAVKNCCVEDTIVDNGGITTEHLDNPFASANTLDKVFLPSFQDYSNSSYGFNGENLSSRQAKTSDYARARGAWCHTRNNKDEATKTNGSYWTRSASSEYSYCAAVINAGGVISNYAVDDCSHSVRPAIRIKIEDMA